MEYFWTIEAILNLLACIPLLLALGIMSKEYLKTKNRQLIIMILGWMFIFLYLFTEGISYIINSMFLYQFHSLFMLATGLLIVIWVDSIDRDSLDPIKISIYTFIAGMTGFFIMQPGVIYEYTFPNGEPSFGIQTQYILWIILANGYQGILWIYFSLKVYLNSPLYLRKYAGLIFWGAILMIAIPLVLVAARLTLVIPGIDALFMGIGGLLIAIVFVKRPQLGYILPFKAIKLAVVGSNTGLLLYLHKWTSMAKKKRGSITPDNADVEDQVFVGMLYGIYQLVKESIRKGDVREITTEEAVLMVHHDEEHPVIYVLLATTPTKSLRTAFNSFVQSFTKEFSQYFYSSYKPSQYQSASKLITQCFPYVPFHTEELRADQKTSQGQSILQIDEQKAVMEHNEEITEKGGVKALKICVSCNNLKPIGGHWQNMENFIRSASRGSVAWDVCPKCKKEKHTLILSYFDQVLGPQILFISPMADITPEIMQVPFILDLENKNYFLYTIGNNVFANYRFLIPSQDARGKEIVLLLSYTNMHGEFNEKFANRLLSEMVNSIKSLSEIDKVFLAENMTDRANIPEFHNLKQIFEQHYHTIPQKIIQFYVS